MKLINSIEEAEHFYKVNSVKLFTPVRMWFQKRI